MKQFLEDFPELDKWLDDEVVWANEILCDEQVVPSWAVEALLIELGNKIEALENQLKGK